MSERPKRVLWWLGFAWAAPVTLAGAILAKVTCGRVWLPNQPDLFKALLDSEAMVYEAGDWLTRNFFQRFHVWAFTWGAVVVFRKDQPLSPSAFRHELVHFKQARLFGVFLPLAYGVGSLVALARGGHAYHDNPLEIWAREESGS